MPSQGQRVSEYVLQRKLGAGAFGEVWLAHHHIWADQQVAIKIPLDTNYLRNLQHEGATVHGLVHPNIVRAIGFDPYATVPYLAMEYVPGTDLRKLVKANLKMQEIVDIMKGVLAGLDYAHARGVVHRDIKPENVLIHQRSTTDGYAAEGVVKVTDFGLGKATNKTAKGSILLSQDILRDGENSIAGTLDYMAPEQRSSADVDARADLYACGVILYELLTGERPAGTELPSDLMPSLPRGFDDIFKKAYARLEKRFGSAADFSRALDEVTTVHRNPGTPPPLPVNHATAAQGGNALKAAYPAQRTTCPHCRQHVESSDQFCIHCGVQLVAMIRRCRNCGAYPDKQDAFCMQCGQGLNAGTSVA